MLKIIVSEEFASYSNQIEAGIDITVVNPNNILDIIQDDKYDGFILSDTFDKYLYKIRNTKLHHTSCIVSLNKNKQSCLYADLLIKDDLNYQSIDKALNFVNEFFTTPSKEAILSILKRLMVSADDDLKTQLYRVPILTNFIVNRLIKENKFKTQLNKVFISDAITYSSLHDIGKISIVHEVLNFAGKYDAYHRRTMNYHPKLGKQFFELLSNIFPEITSEVASNIILYHHEKFDGSGYPIGLIGDEIPLEARIVAIADVYDALRSKRKYKEAYSHRKSFDILVNDSGIHFDPTIIEVLKLYEQELNCLYDDLI